MSTFASDTSKRSLKNWIIALSILLGYVTTNS